MKRFFLSEKKMMMVILLNAVVIFFLYFPELHDNKYLIWLDHIFIVIYLIEAIVKLSVLKPKAYFKDNWNKFDFSIVVLSLPSLLYTILPFADTGAIVLLRLFRLIRLIRFVRFVPHLTQIIEGLGRALKASVFVLLVLLVLNFMLALFSCHFYSNIAPEYFGNPLISSYSIFQMFTVEGWNEIPANIGAKLDSEIYAGVTKFFFVLVVLVGGIFGMSLANAIFVDEMTMDNAAELEKKIETLQDQIAEIKEILLEKSGEK